MNMEIIINIFYIVAAVFFIVGLKKMSSPATARSGNILSSMGMLIAVLVTLIDHHILEYHWIGLGLIIGSIIGLFLARTVPMTGMPEMVALLNGFGGIASLLVGWGSLATAADFNVVFTFSIFLAVLIGGVTFSGSLIAWAKLKEVMTGKPILFTGQQIVNGLLLFAALFSGVMLCLNPQENMSYFWVLLISSLALGIFAVISIGGGDMPVVISLLNSYSGCAACASGFVIQNNLLIVTGALVGASGIILTKIMCKAMNRSLTNVLFSGFGSGGGKTSQTDAQGEIKALTAQDAYLILEAARSVVIVPGYGMAVAQAQHVIKELADHLEENGCEVKFAIHPVAGRMPGHMNVLLAEADVSYDKLVEMDTVNPSLPNTDICLVVGANDVVNPDARENKQSPIYGMPIINVDKSKTVFVLKRSMGKGFAGIENPLFFKENTRMIFGDAKSTLQSLVSEFKAS